MRRCYVLAVLNLPRPLRLREDYDLVVEVHLGGVGVHVHDDLGFAYREVVRQPSGSPTALYLRIDPELMNLLH